jgi:hypothetical protein
LVLAAGIPAPAAAGERPPSRLRLLRLVEPLVPGQQVQLVVETVGEHNEPLAVMHPLVVSLLGANGLTAMTRVTIKTGASKVEVPLSAVKPGLWQIDARAEGLYSASTVVVCVAPEVLQHHQAVAAAPVRRTAGAPAPLPALPPPGAAAPHTAAPAAVRAAPPAAAGVPPRAPSSAAASRAPQEPASAPAAAANPPPARTDEERLRALATPPAAPPRLAPRSLARPIAAPSAAGRAAAPAAAAERAAAGTGAPAPAGEVRLIPEHLERYRGPQGWESVSVDAYWYEKGKPAVAPRELDLALIANQGDLQIDPSRLDILPGDYVTRAPAKVTAIAPAKASLQALYPGGQSNLVDVSFLAAPAAKLSFSSGPQVIRAFGVASSEVYVRLLDASGVPALAEQPIQITLQLSGPTGSRCRVSAPTPSPPRPPALPTPFRSRSRSPSTGCCCWQRCSADSWAA